MQASDSFTECCTCTAKGIIKVTYFVTLEKEGFYMAVKDKLDQRKCIETVWGKLIP